MRTFGPYKGSCHMLRTWLNKLRSRLVAPRKATSRRPGFRLQLESLEERWTPATLTVGPSSTYHTIMAAVSAANSGDVINVNAGTYQEQVVIPSKGANNKPITSLALNSLGAAPSPSQGSA